MFNKGGDFPDERWVAEIEESDVFTAYGRSSRGRPSRENSLPPSLVLYEASEIYTKLFTNKLKYSEKNYTSFN